MAWPLSRSRWRKKSTESKGYFIFLSLTLTFLLISLFLFFSFASSFQFFLLPKTLSRSHSTTIQCGPQTLTGAKSLARERFIWYAPHSGFSNQLSELKNAIIFAAILNRTLIVPPVLDHHAVALGSCPKFRVTSPSDLRNAVWDHVMDLVRDQRYISMADIVDLSSVSPRALKIIDFRIFASLWCGLNMDGTCHGNLCCAISSMGSTSNNFNYCRSLLSGLYGNVKQCLHAVEEDCRTTVWTYQQGNDGTLDSFQHDEQFQKRKKISFVRKHRDLYKAFGPGSEAEMAKILSFGSLFTSPYKGSELYIDIHKAPTDSRIQSLLEDIEFLPFAPELIAAGKEIAQNKIREPFLCAQLRLLDGQFKNHRKITFSALREKLQSLHSKNEGNNGNGLIHIFIMTDLPTSNWTGTYLEDIASNTKSYKLYTLTENDERVVQAGKRLVAAERGFNSGFLPRNINTMKKNGVCSPALLPDILLYIEEIVCSCASVGFVGTAGSTIAESILMMRKSNICKL
ncbi:hypothetical protein IEQ34_022806 [Dendrobium chrysotoxum]|uniref:O-fucosyltransferase family protein n=1 Tax=Dendrobium chrysotoxum TaxID=161865 RepID=A0AAV7FYD8_DENCH|nr:hypothetical protein IEQ34_022806 [Dendrobium chrysotoxum]